MKHSIGQASNGVPIYVDLIYSRAATHIAQQPHLLGLISEALQQTVVQGTKLTVEHDMKRNIGYDIVIETTDKDTILWAQLVRDDNHTRFVKNGTPLATKYLTIMIQQDDDGNYELHDAWIGRMSPPRPGSVNATPESNLYWENHAFVLDNQPLQLRTVTKVCPY